ncbi:MAG: homocysteine S-methyltransferase family protein [Chloroflexota bacterium]|nr:homocysteine S-methyltransferase family protein [Chloroflexota bacterium]
MGGRPSLADRVRSGPALLLDAAMGSDLDRRGLATTLPLWSVIGLIERPDLVRSIHRDNLEAGADILTTNTFRSTARTLRKGGLDEAAADRLDRLAVELALAARDETGRAGALIAGSIAPLDECYDPVFETADDIALAEHAAQARNLAAAGVDFLMIETMPTIREAVLTTQAALQTGLPVTVGFVCEPAADAGSAARLMSGESLAEAVKALRPFPVTMIFANCAAPGVISSALWQLRNLTDIPMGGYANVGQVDDDVGWNPAGVLRGGAYAEAAAQWLDLGARVIGGCCGTHPEHTLALRRLIDERSAA